MFRKFQVREFLPGDFDVVMHVDSVRTKTYASPKTFSERSAAEDFMKICEANPPKDTSDWVLISVD